MSERKYDGRHTVGEVPEKIDANAFRELGPCPSCGASLSVGVLTNPNTGRPARAVSHPMPFCHYFGATSTEQIESDIVKKTEVH